MLMGTKLNHAEASKKPRLHATLIMTATVNPPLNCPSLLRADPAVRMKDYCEALKYYLRNSSAITHIIFVENSESNLDPLIQLENTIKHDKVVEFLCFAGGNDYPAEYGKGYGEMAMLNYAVDNSKIIRSNKNIWKGTGRLILLNIDTLIKNAPPSYEIYCDLHNGCKLLRLGNFFDPRFYSFTVEAYNKYLRLAPEQLRFAHIEHLFYPIIKKAINNGNIFPRFRQQPLIAGYAASLDSNYFGWNKKIQRRIQQVMRFAMPWIWL